MIYGRNLFHEHYAIACIKYQQLTTKFEQGSNQLLDHYLPQLLTPPTYHSDGQILDEVFVYGSFVQSKMYHSGVGCVDCHQPHSVKLKAEGNQLCVGCHSSELFDTPTHHQHGMEGALSTAKNDQAQGTQCIDCHMPGRLYMGNDYRRDHSFRIPRPDLSVDHGTPNACNDCHSKESAEWAAAKIAEWFGPERPAHFSEILTAAASQPNDSVEPLVSLLKDLSQPAIARATAAPRCSCFFIISIIGSNHRPLFTHRAVSRFVVVISECE